MSSEPKPNIRPGVRGICRNGFWTPPLESGPFDRVTAGPMYWTSRGQYDDGESPWDIIGIVEDLPPVPSPQQKSYWRLLEPGEVIQEGDEFWDYRLGKFAPTSVIIGMVPESAVYRRRVHAPEPQPAPQIPGMPKGWEFCQVGKGLHEVSGEFGHMDLVVRRIKPPEPVCNEQIRPAILLPNGETIYPTGTEWLVAFAIRGCQWAIDMIQSEQSIKVGPEAEALLKGGV